MPDQMQEHRYQGQVHRFPASWTPEQVAAALATLPPPKPSKPEDYLGTARDAGLLKGAASEFPIPNPITAIKQGFGNVADLVQKARAGDWKGATQAGLRLNPMYGPAMGIAQPIQENLPKAGSELMQGNVIGAVDSGLKAVPFYGPTYQNVRDRIDKQDYSGALGAAGMGALTAVATPAHVKGVAGKISTPITNLTKRGGLGLMGAVLDATPAVAKQALEEGAGKWGIASGARNIETKSQDAASRATASVTDPTVNPNANPNVRYAERPRQPRTPPISGAEPNQPMSPSYADHFDRVRREAEAEKLKHYTRPETIAHAERARKGAIDLVENSSKNNLAAQDLAGQGRYHRERVSHFLPEEGRAALADIDRLEPVGTAFAHAKSQQAKTGATPLLGPVLKPVHQLLSAGSGTLAHGLYGASGMTDTAISNMLRAAVLARLGGG